MRAKEAWPSEGQKGQPTSLAKRILPGESAFVMVNGIKTHYLVAGDGPPVLLIHGLGASVVTWRDNVEPLSQRFRVYAIDLPGHGDTDKPDIDYTLETMLDYLRGFLDALGLGRVSLVGSSAAGAVAFYMALNHPDRVDKLVLVDSAGLGRQVSPYLRLVALPLLGNVLESHRVGGTRFMLYNVFYDKSFVAEELLQELYRSRCMPGAKEAVVRTIRNGVGLWGVRKKFMFLDRLSKLEAPLLVVWGAQDQIFPAAQAYAAQQAAPSISLKVFDQCGHWPHMEKAQEFNQLVSQFLSS